MLKTPDDVIIPYYSFSVFIFGFFAWLQLVIEPLWVLAQSNLFIKLKVITEGSAMIIKCLLTIFLIIYKPQWGLLCFCVSQAAHCLVHIIAYYGYFLWLLSDKKRQKRDLPLLHLSETLPSSLDGAWFDRDASKLTFSFFKQSILKQVLTEGERYVMTVLDVLSFSDQGVYDVINNLGSLAARFIFLPIEESFYLFFAKMLKRGVVARHDDVDNQLMTSRVLFCLLRFVMLVAGIILAFGLPYSKLLLDLYGGQLLSSGSGPILLQTYCFYVLLIAVNGTTECFVFAAMDQKQIDRYNRKMFIFSTIFLISSFYFTSWFGSVGFIFANCLNMIARIIHSLIYIHKYYKDSKIKQSPLRGIIPNKFVIFSLILSSVICSVSGIYFSSSVGWFSKLIHVFVGCCCLIVVFFSILFCEKSVVEFLQKQYFTRKAVKVD